MKLVKLRNLSDRIRLPFDVAQDKGLTVESGASTEFSETTAAALLRDEPALWERVSTPEVEPAPAAEEK